MARDRNDTGRTYVSHHILPTAANLLGLCFVILSVIKVMKIGAQTVIDELVAAAIVIFLVASIFSYASIRSQTRSELLERIADSIFLAGLGILTITSLIVVFEII
jgi:multisubunit Na+/H+ antiporter MnhG subunit